jgi:membrane protease subunit HflC
VTKEDFRDREHYINMKNCITVLLQNNVIPILNENDVISVTELMFTDNDELAGLVSGMVDADKLVILSNVKGIYDGAPNQSSSKLIPYIEFGDTGFERFITSEKKNLLVDSYVKWRIVDPRKYFISFKGDERLAQDRLSQLVKSALNEEFTKRTVRELISEQREQVMLGIKKKVADDTADIGIEIVDVRLKRVDLLAEISDSVYRRMEAERKRVANELRSTGAAESEKIRADAERQRDVILAQAYREAQKIKGQGDAQANAIYNEAFSKDVQFAQFYRSLEAYKATFKDKKDVMVLSPDSDFFKFMKKSK